jgi:hypothetical protein
MTLGRRQPAWDAYHKAIEFRGPFAFRARYQLAQAEMDFRSPNPIEVAEHLKQASALLMQNLDAVAGSDTPSDVRERSQFLLGQLLFQQREYFQAKLYLEAAVDQYPSNSQILDARERLADCFRRLADQQMERLNSPDSKGDAQLNCRRKKNLYLEKAVDHYQRLADDLDRRDGSGRLTAAEQSLLRRSAFALAGCRADQDNMTDEAFRLYQALAEKRYPGQVECLAAYQNMWACACRLNQPEVARAALRNAWLALEKLSDDELNKLPANAFRGYPGPLTRDAWKKYITLMADQLPRPGADAARE